MTNAITIVDPFSGSKAIVIEHAFDILAAGSGTLKDFAVWSELEPASLEGIKSAISNPSLLVTGPEPLDNLVWADFQKLSYQQGSVDSKSDFYNEKIVSSIDFRLNGFEEKVLGFGRIGRRDDRYDASAVNGDPGSDNTVQDGTPWERPAGARGVAAAVRRRMGPGAAGRATTPASGGPPPGWNGTTPGTVQPQRRRVGILNRLANAIDVSGSDSSPQGSTPAPRARRARRPAPAPRASRAAPNPPPPPAPAPPAVQTPDAPGRRVFASALERLAGRIDPGEAGEGGRSKRWGIQNYEKGLKHVYEKDGDITDIADEHIIDVLFDENLEILGRSPAGYTLTKEDLVTASGQGGLLPDGSTFKNKRFEFEIIKTEGGNRDVPWRVMQVTDTLNGGVWYVKVSTYGNHDSLLENIGSKAAEVLGFGNREKNFRVGQSVDRSGSPRPYRWMMLKSIEEWEFDHTPAAGREGKWKEWNQVSGSVDQSKLDPSDMARMLLLDYLFDNSDRHGGNYMARVDSEGRVRLGLIDHGLLYGGRGLESAIYSGVADASAKSFKQYYEGSVCRKPFRHLSVGLKGTSSAAQVRRRKFQQAADRAIERLEEDLGKIVSADRISSKGKVLTPEELQHLDAVRTVAEARLAILQRDGSRQILDTLLKWI